MSKFYIPCFSHRRNRAAEKTPPYAKAEKLTRQLILTWAFICQEGLLDEALDFLDDHEDFPLTFEALR